METINFKELEIKNIDGTTQKVDIANQLANVLYYSTNSIAAISWKSHTNLTHPGKVF